MQLVTAANAVSAASRPVTIRTSDGRGARPVASCTPAPILEGIKDSVEVHRKEPRCVDGDETSRHPRSPAQRHSEMREEGELDEDREGRRLMTVTFERTQYAAQELLGLGADVEVLEPLRLMIVDAVGSHARLYDGTDRQIGASTMQAALA